MLLDRSREETHIAITATLLLQATNKTILFCPQNGVLPDVRRNCSTVDGVVTAIKPISWKEIRTR